MYRTPTYLPSTYLGTTINWSWCSLNNRSTYIFETWFFEQIVEPNKREQASLWKLSVESFRSNFQEEQVQSASALLLGQVRFGRACNEKNNFVLMYDDSLSRSEMVATAQRFLFIKSIFSFLWWLLDEVRVNEPRMGPIQLKPFALNLTFL